MRNELFNKSFTPGAAVAAYRICKHGAADNEAIQAAAATDESLGVSNHLGAAATDTTVDLVMAGIAEIEYGGTVTRGANLTADADGKAVVATAEGSRIIGKAMVAGVTGDIGSVFLAPSVLAVSGSA